MNNKLRKLMNVKNALRRKYYKNRTTENWNKYRNYRNQVTKLRRKSVMQYMEKKCKENVQNGKDFWKTIKPVISDKNKMSNNVILLENNMVVNDPQMVSDIMNEHFVNAASGIGKPDSIEANDNMESILAEHGDSESVRRIRRNIVAGHSFKFSPVNSDYVLKKLSSINTKKSMGHDQLPPKMIKLGAEYLCKPITSLINMSFETSVYPHDLKAAEVTPIFKKCDRMNKENYRPVSVLPCLSKVFESVYIDQLSSYFEEFFAPVMSGFRKSHSCQHVLIDLLRNAGKLLMMVKYMVHFSLIYHVLLIVSHPNY